MPDNDSTAGRIIGRYVLCSEVAWGGMATVHLGKLLGPAGFARTVAIKRLHPPFAKDPEFVSMFLDEARLAASNCLRASSTRLSRSDRIPSTTC